MRRRGSIIVSVIFVVLVLGGYSIASLFGVVPSPWGDVKKIISGETTKSPNEVYGLLDSAISSPERSSSLTEKFTVSVYIAGEVFEETFEDEDGDIVHKYQTAYISRSENSFALDVRNLEKPLEKNKYYKVTAQLNGHVYWTEDNKKKTVLDVLASKAEPFTPSEEPSSADGTISIGDGTITFKGAHLAESSIDKAVVLYFDHKNTGSQDTAPNFDITYFYLKGDSKELKPLTGLTSLLKGLDPSALEYKWTEKTYPGKTQRYFYALELENDSKTNTPLIVERYDDDFNLICYAEITVAKDLAALKK
ncbi:MAG: DUF5067 domain-containing protein [Oscillospiraceae bacterium]|jgi:hypothetical protein|nr:DUF5067 domain-containing protein [Oscillospiraceae bacterium]